MIYILIFYYYIYYVRQVKNMGCDYFTTSYLQLLCIYTFHERLRHKNRFKNHNNIQSTMNNLITWLLGMWWSSCLQEAYFVGVMVIVCVQLWTLKIPTNVSANSNIFARSEIIMNWAFFVLSWKIKTSLKIYFKIAFLFQYVYTKLCMIKGNGY